MMRARGFTLIEVLISVTLVSLLSAGLLMAMRVGLSAMQKADDRLMSNRRVMSTQQILEQQIAGLMPVPAECLKTSEGPPARIAFFEGLPASMRFVSTYSLHEASRGVPKILEFQVIPGENGAGVRLVLNEWLYTGPAGAGRFCTGVIQEPGSNAPIAQFLPIQTGANSFVLADKLAFCRFTFRSPRPAGAPPDEDAKWVASWNSIDHLPDAIRIEMGPLTPDAGRLQPVTMTEPVRVNRLPLVPYGDQ
ncbi:MAG TPA: prepilin-type N-terminal cleavage/methylation domain-containing protein [Bryobacteraceae bacterium]|nr:prepilin-type N-terminal cleavage/methylation domain-containing protein [Bryobacteraceae bacterium]